MIVVKLKGGLGNQMFQYAAGRALAVRAGTDLLLDTKIYGQTYNREYGLDKFRIHAREATDKELARGYKELAQDFEAKAKAIQAN